MMSQHRKWVIGNDIIHDDHNIQQRNKFASANNVYRYPSTATFYNHFDPPSSSSSFHYSPYETTTNYSTFPTKSVHPYASRHRSWVSNQYANIFDDNDDYEAEAVASLNSGSNYNPYLQQGDNTLGGHLIRKSRRSNSFTSNKPYRPSPHRSLTINNNNSNNNNNNSGSTTTDTNAKSDNANGETEESKDSDLLPPILGEAFLKRRNTVIRIAKDNPKRKKSRLKLKDPSLLLAANFNNKGINKWVSPEVQAKEEEQKLSQRRHKLVDVNGIMFIMDRSGRKLIRQSEYDPANAKNEPRRIQIGAQSFIRTKNGNMTLQKGNRSTGRQKKVKRPCFELLKTGSCSKLEKGEPCSLEHSPSKEQIPICRHFEYGRCGNEDCKFLHVKLSSHAKVCYPFSRQNWCDSAEHCLSRHVWECFGWVNLGECDDPKYCKYQHPPDRRYFGSIDDYTRLQEAKQLEKQQQKLAGQLLHPESSSAATSAVYQESITIKDDDKQQQNQQQRRSSYKADTNYFTRQARSRENSTFNEADIALNGTHRHLQQQRRYHDQQSVDDDASSSSEEEEADDDYDDEDIGGGHHNSSSKSSNNTFKLTIRDLDDDEVEEDVDWSRDKITF